MARSPSTPRAAPASSPDRRCRELTAKSWRLRPRERSVERCQRASGFWGAGAVGARLELLLLFQHGGIDEPERLGCDIGFVAHRLDRDGRGQALLGRERPGPFSDTLVRHRQHGLTLGSAVKCRHRAPRRPFSLPNASSTTAPALLRPAAPANDGHMKGSVDIGRSGIHMNSSGPRNPCDMTMWALVVGLTMTGVGIILTKGN